MGGGGPDETRERTPWWVTALLVIGLIALLGGLVVGGVAWWFHANKNRLLAEGKKAGDEGKAFAVEHDQRACVDEGVARCAACNGPTCEAMASVFASVCLETAELSSPDVCDGVPAHGEILKTVGWAAAECERRGRANDQSCQRFFHGFTSTCENASLRARRNE